MTLNDFMAELERDPPPPATFPLLRYDHDGDTLEVWLSGESYYGEWVNPSLTLYRSQESGAVVGVLIEGVGPLREARRRQNR